MLYDGIDKLWVKWKPAISIAPHMLSYSSQDQLSRRSSLSTFV